MQFLKRTRQNWSDDKRQTPIYHQRDETAGGNWGRSSKCWWRLETMMARGSCSLQSPVVLWTRLQVSSHWRISVTNHGHKQKWSWFSLLYLFVFQCIEKYQNVNMIYCSIWNMTHTKDCFNIATSFFPYVLFEIFFLRTSTQIVGWNSFDETETCSMWGGIWVHSWSCFLTDWEEMLDRHY